MKYKLQTLLICIILFLLFLTSCGKELVYLDDILPDSETVAPIELNEEQQANPNWQPIPEYDPTVPHAEPIRSTPPYFVETKHCVVFQDIRGETKLRYINKATGEAHILCGDPLCDHENCSAFPILVSFTSFLYSHETGRLYWVRPVPEDYYQFFFHWDKERFEIVSIGIDEMDFTVKRHYLTKPGDQIQTLTRDGEKLYFSYHVLEG